MRRVEELQRERRAEIERLVQGMSLEDHRHLTSQLLERQPGLVFDVLLDNQRRDRHTTPVQAPALTWCTCGNCTDMPTDAERKCCGQDSVNCISLLPHFRLYCLDEGVLRIHRQYRADLTVLGQIREPGDDNREYRYAAYRHFIFWQHGSLGHGNRRVIPSCCVVKIREKFPDPHGQYTGFLPGV
nr:P2X purinoceptor 7-like [Nothobranchius furzeri]